MVAKLFSDIDLMTLMKEFVFPFGIPLLIIVVALFVGVWANRRIKEYLVNHYDVSSEDSFRYILFNGMQGLPVVMALLCALYILIDIIPLPKNVDHILYCLLLTVALFAVARLVSRCLNALIDIKTKKLGQSVSSTTLLSSIVNAMIYIVFGLTLLSHYGISITPLITALGVGSMAIAFGLQETMANLFAGMHLVISKQVRLNDFVKLASGEEGRVGDISWRFTTIISAAGNAIIIPNNKMASSIITNYNMPVTELTVIVPVGVSYDSDLDKVEQVALEVAKKVTRELEGDVVTTPPAVFYQSFGDFSINFNVVLHPSQFANQLPLRHRFIKEMLVRCREEGIEIPYPIHTVINAGAAPADGNRQSLS